MNYSFENATSLFTDGRENPRDLHTRSCMLGALNKTKGSDRSGSCIEGHVNGLLGVFWKPAYSFGVEKFCYWVDGREAVYRANGNKPLILCTVGYFKLETMNNLEDAYYNMVYFRLNPPGEYKFPPEIIHALHIEYIGKGNHLERQCPICEEKRLEEQTKQKEIDALILPIVQYLKAKLQENTTKTKDVFKGKDLVEYCDYCELPKTYCLC